jgi:hypothetical protein
VSFRLHGVGARLLIVQRLRVLNGRPETLTYQYRISLSDEKDSWLIRWEYFRHPPAPHYPYPLGHVHVNGRFSPSTVAALAKLHVPTGLVPPGLVLWHLIAEWGVRPKRDDSRERVAWR